MHEIGGGHYYFNARWYDASTGRFTREDPVRDGVNWYVYVGNNPLVMVDPSGLSDTSLEAYGAEMERRAAERMEAMASAFEEDWSSLGRYLHDPTVTREILQQMVEDVAANMGAYNSIVGVTSSEDYLPGASVTSPFGEAQGPYADIGDYETTAHAGTDFSFGNREPTSDFRTPYFTRVDEVGQTGIGDDVTAYVVLEIIGTGEYLVTRHLDTEDVTSLRPGTVIFPHEEYVDYPSGEGGARSSGAHGHIERISDHHFVDLFTGETPAADTEFMWRQPGEGVNNWRPYRPIR